MQKSLPTKSKSLSIKKEEKPSKKHWLIAALLLLLFVSIAGGWYFWPDGQLSRVRQMREELTSEEAKNLTPDELQLKWEELREAERKLSPQQRFAVNVERTQKFTKKFNEKLDRYFAASPEEKKKILDDDINNMGKGRGKGGPGGGKGGPGGIGGGKGGPGGGGPGGGGRGQRGGGNNNGNAQAANDPNKGQNNDPNQPQNNDPNRQRSADDRDNFRKMMLNASSPEERAQRTVYFSDMQARRQQLGMPPLKFGPR